ncbi:hypothetical protein BH11ACT3_BH11ACT3_13870 [soil metagenome]
MAMSLVGVGTWTVLDDLTDRVRAVVSREPDGYCVRDDSGHVLGHYPTVQQALEALPQAS